MDSEPAWHGATAWVWRLAAIAVSTCSIGIEQTYAQSDDLAVLKAGRAVILLNAAGTASQKKGAYAEAEGHFKNALSIIEKVWGPDNANVGVTLNNLALLYKEQGRFDDAENVYKRSLEILEKAAGPNHPEVANTLENLAELYRAQGRNADGLPLLERSQAFKEGQRFLNRLGQTNSALAKWNCNVHSLGPGQDRIAMNGWTFNIFMQEASKPVVMDCRPRAPSVRAADGTPGALSCVNLRKSRTLLAGLREPVVFVGDPNFVYEIRLKDRRDKTTVRVCVQG